MGESKEYLEVKRTVADLYPADWVKNDFPEIADFMDSYREKNYAGRPDSYKIAWDGMGDVFLTGIKSTEAGALLSIWQQRLILNPDTHILKNTCHLWLTINL